MMIFGRMMDDVTLIETKTLTADTQTIDFTSLGQFKKFLFYVEFETDNGNADDVRLFFNDDTTVTNYYVQTSQQYATTTSAARVTEPRVCQLAANEIGFFRGWIIQTVGNKAYFESNWNYDKQDQVRICKGVGDWVTTNAITKITFKVVTNKFKAGSVLSLYGLK